MFFILIPSLLKEQREGRKGGLRKENDKPQLFTKEIILLLPWARISKKRTVICQAWLCYILAPFKKKNVIPEALRERQETCALSVGDLLIKNLRNLKAS